MCISISTYPSPLRCLTTTFPAEILNYIIDLILTDDLKRNQVLSLLRVCKTFFLRIDERLRPRVEVTQLPGGEFSAKGYGYSRERPNCPLNVGDDHPSPSTDYENWLPSMIGELDLCMHGMCYHDQIRLGLNSPNQRIRTLRVSPRSALAPGERAVCRVHRAHRAQQAQDGGPPCPAMELLSPRKLVIDDPAGMLGRRALRGIVKEGVKALVFELASCPVRSSDMVWMSRMISWYHVDFDQVEEVTVVLPVFTRWYLTMWGYNGEVFARQLVEGFANIFEEFRGMVVERDGGCFTFVNCSQPFIATQLKSFATYEDLPRTIVARGDTLQRWFFSRMMEWDVDERDTSDGLSYAEFSRRVQFITLEEYQKRESFSVGLRRDGSSLQNALSCK